MSPSPDSSPPERLSLRLGDYTSTEESLTGTLTLSSSDVSSTSSSADSESDYSLNSVSADNELHTVTRIPRGCVHTRATKSQEHQAKGVGLKLRSLLPLVLTLRDSLVIFDNEYHLLDISDKQLVEFKKYAARIESITISDDNSSSSRLSGATYMQIGILSNAATSPLFSALTSLTLDQNSAYLFYLPLFSTPSLRSLTVVGMAERNLPSLTSFLRTEHARTRLSVLHLSSIPLKPSLVRSIAFCRGLETIRLMDISQQFVCVDKILSLPRLKQFALDIQDGTDFELRNPCFRPPITALEISGSSSIVYSTLSALKYNGDLEKLTINITSYNPGTSFNDIVFDTLVPLATASSKTLKEVVFIAHCGGESEIAEGTIAAFAHCLRFQTLQLDTTTRFSFSKELSKFPAFSPLTHLRLPINDHSDALSNRGLCLLATACPELVQLRALLALPFDDQWTNGHPANTNSFHFRHLRSLSAGSHEQIEDEQIRTFVPEMCAIVHHLFVVFPALTEVETHEGFLQEFLARCQHDAEINRVA